MKKVILFSLVIMLLVSALVPALVAPKQADAWSGTVTCSPTSLNFRVYAGVPTYLLGFIPLDEGQTLTLTHANGGWDGTIAGWTVSDNAGWLNENLLFGVISGSGHSDITVRVNTDGLTAGTYTATITFKFTTCGTKTITVPVTVDVIAPAVLGPLGIGVDKDLLKNVAGREIISEENEYTGLVANLLTNPDDMMDMQAIETDGSWSLNFSRGDELSDGTLRLNGGTLTINGETKQIVGGGVAPISMLMSMMGGGALPIPADFDWGQNYAALFVTSDGKQYVGILLADLPKLLDLLPMLGGMFSTEEAGTDMNGAPPDPNPNTGDSSNEPTASVDMVIPLAPILNLLPSLMPVMTDLLGNETIMAILTPLMQALPPIMIVMPYDLLIQLVTGLM